MDNYKIKVKDESSADEARDLFKKLGYHPDNSSYEPYVEWVAVFEDGSGSFYSHNMNLNECVEITIAQLQDLVVLKRNDVKDATHRDKQQNSIYLTSDMVIYYWQGEWCKSAINKSNDYENYIANSLTPITQPQDPALISGADALRYIACGRLVQWISKDFPNWEDLDITNINAKNFIDEERIRESGFKYRLKPQTIKVELELPKPFEPKVGEVYWFISPFYSTGYDHCTFANDSADKLHVQYGAYRTEDDVKKAVEQLRKIRGTN
ncbi:TPA: hypothetical protein RP447_000818 [Acinetobacter baumannii]|nr:hypothetical protein [Acinetobacter baumannii]HDX6121104.1 hypothetical protein [Acinetobacter baumannii]